MSSAQAERRLRKARATSELIKGISDPIRLAVVLMLAGGERHAGAIGEALGLKQPTVDHHLALLRHGRLITPRRRGRNVFYGLTEKGGLLAETARGLSPDQDFPHEAREG